MVKIITPTLLQDPKAPEYAAELAILEQDQPKAPLAKTIADIVKLRNEALSIYRAHKDDDVLEGIKLSDIVFGELSFLEGRIQTLLAGYRALKTARPTDGDQLSIEPALRWYLDDTLRWMRLNAFHNLPREDYMRLQAGVDLLRASDGGVRALLPSVVSTHRPITEQISPNLLYLLQSP